MKNPYDEQERPAPQSLGDLVAGRVVLASKTKRGGINHPFNNAVGMVLEFMGEKEAAYLRKKGVKDVFGYWCGKLRGVPVQTIHSWMSQARERGTKNPASLFTWLLNDFRAKQKAQKVIHTTALQQEA